MMFTVYDMYGEGRLKGQVPPPDAGYAGGSSFFHGGDGPNVFRFNPRSADNIFAEFFGFSSPFVGMRGGGGMRGGSRFPGGMFGDDMFSSFREAQMSQTRKAEPIENTLPCSLEELYKGTTKKMKISREIADTPFPLLQEFGFLSIFVMRVLFVPLILRVFMKFYDLACFCICSFERIWVLNVLAMWALLFYASG